MEVSAVVTPNGDDEESLQSAGPDFAVLASLGTGELILAFWPDDSFAQRLVGERDPHVRIGRFPSSQLSGIVPNRAIGAEIPQRGRPRVVLMTSKDRLELANDRLR